MPWEHNRVTVTLHHAEDTLVLTVFSALADGVRVRLDLRRSPDLLECRRRGCGPLFRQRHARARDQRRSGSRRNSRGRAGYCNVLRPLRRHPRGCGSGRAPQTSRVLKRPAFRGGRHGRPVGLPVGGVRGGGSPPGIRTCSGTLHTHTLVLTITCCTLTSSDQDSIPRSYLLTRVCLEPCALRLMGGDRIETSAAPNYEATKLSIQGLPICLGEYPGQFFRRNCFTCVSTEFFLDSWNASTLIVLFFKYITIYVV